MDSEVIAALSAWRQRGHRIALDDFSFEESDTGLLAFAHIVKLDVKQLSSRRLERTDRELRSRKRPPRAAVCFVLFRTGNGAPDGVQFLQLAVPTD